MSGTMQVNPARIVKAILPLVLLCVCSLVSAQAPPGEGPAAGAEADAEAGVLALPCVPAGETGAADGEPGVAGSAPPPCPESGAEPEGNVEPLAAEPSDPADAGPAAAAEEDSGIEASADEVFTPGDEISEDFPIPLPSDI